MQLRWVLDVDHRVDATCEEDRALGEASRLAFWATGAKVALQLKGGFSVCAWGVEELGHGKDTA